MMVFFGLGMWAQKGLFVKPITEALDIPRSAYSISNTFRYGTTALVNIFFGYLIGKFGVKKLVLIAFFSLTIAPLCYAFATNVILFYVGGCLLGIGFSFGSTAIVGYIINRTCKKNQGTILGFILCANGLAGALFALIMTPIIENSTFGYKNAFYVMAVVALLTAIVILVFFREPKETERQETKGKNNFNWVGISYRQATKKIYFYLACIAILFTGIILTAVTSNYQAHLGDRGFSGKDIGIIAVISSVSLAVFKLVNGFTYDKLGLRVTITTDCIAGLLIMVILYLITPTPAGLVLGIAYAILSGVALPLETVMIPIYAKDLFGELSYAQVLGIFISLNQIGYALGDPLFNLIYDVNGSYDLGLIICAVLMAIVIVLLQIVISTAKKLKKQLS